MNGAEWNYMEFDLEARLKQLRPGASVLTVDGVWFWARDLYVDDIVLSGGGLEKSYQLNPSAAISGYLGAQSGEAGGQSQDP